MCRSLQSGRLFQCESRCVHRRPGNHDISADRRSESGGNSCR
jgi:hypothetical protein